LFSFSQDSTAAATAATTVEKKKKSLLAKKKSVKKSATKVFTIDASEPAADEIFDLASFEKFLHDRIKIGGKTGVLGDAVTISRDGSVLTVTSKVAMSKRSLKYLTKKFLKKQLLRDYIRVIAKSKNGYFLRYLNINKDGEDADE
jgi:large subunit ribosomal protein L22e